MGCCERDQPVSCIAKSSDGRWFRRVAKARDGRENRRLSGTRTVASCVVGRPFNLPLPGCVGTAGYCVHLCELHSLVQCDA